MQRADVHGLCTILLGIVGTHVVTIENARPVDLRRMPHARNTFGTAIPMYESGIAFGRKLS